ncbi:MAG TPA: FAD-binding oxidoreductase [Acetobacteraceae bacterium]|nr:FAD-binding oxidoreductase [Acetobacteraceae bacterium]
MREVPYWWDHAPPTDVDTPTIPARADVAVIGSGYTGLSAALTLARAGRSVVVFDSETPGVGASSRNGGMLGSALKPSLDTLTRHYGAAQAKALLAESREAYAFLGRFIAEEKIACDYAETGGFTGIVKPAQYEAMARETEQLSRTIGLEADMVPKSEVRGEIGTDLYCGGRVMHRRAGLHPARYHAGLIGRVREAGAMVAGNSPVKAVHRNGGDFTVTTPRTSLKARNVVVATNGYTGPTTPALRRRVIPVTSYMIATAPLSPNLMATLMPKGRMLSDSNRLLCYFRPSPDNTRVLFGGRPAYTEIGPKLAAERLSRYMTRIFPELHGVELTHSWFGYIAYTFDRLPHMGECDGMHYAMGYCGSGVVMSTWLGRKAALRLLGHADAKSAFAELGHPTSPLYYGKPWFLPFVQAWYQGADMLGR